MAFLDILSLVIACVAIAFGVVTVVRARTAAEVAVAARSAAEQALRQAEDARADAAGALEQARDARADAANALDQATTARQDAVQARQSVAAATRALASAPHTVVPGAAARGIAGPGAAGSGASEAVAAAEPVRWSLEHVKGVLWLMMNAGDQTAHSALLSDVTQPPKYIRPDEVIPRDVAPEDHLQFRVTAPRTGPPPRLRVTWREDSDADPKSKEVTLLLE